MAGAAALATATASMALSPVFEDGAWFWSAMAAVAAVTAAGITARVLRAPWPLVLLAQAATLLAVLAHQAAREVAYLGFLPGPAALGRLGDVLAAAFDEVAVVAAPAPATPLLVALAVGGVGAVALVVDALAVTGRWAAIAGLPLLGVYAVPAAVVPDGVPWPLFVIGAIGYLVLLLTDGRQRLGRWGRVIGARSESASSTPEPLGALGRRIGLIALAAAVVAPLFLPWLDGGVLGNGSGEGSGSGGRTVTTVNPLVSLQRDLTRVDDAEVLRYTTTASGPDYLRMVTLDTFDGVQWQPAVLRARAAAQVADGLPEPSGLSDEVRRARVTTTIEVGPLAENRLPLPYPAAQVDIEGDWRYDEATLNVLTPDDDRTTENIDYTVVSVQPAPTAAQLRAAGEAPEEVLVYTELPPVTALATQLAEEVAGEAPTGYDAAVALQAWFQGGGGFAYDLTAQPRSDDPLADFLTDRRGFCQQFAGAFAVMARLLGIPARVNVGFAPGAPTDDDGWAVTWNDVHAWPELYFEGAGWVRFEPTPGNSGAGVATPAYAPFASQLPGATPGGLGPSDADQDRLNPTQADRAAEGSAVNPRERALDEAVTGAQEQAPSRLPWLAVALALALLAVAAAPATRAWRRRRRLSAAARGSAEAAWAEVLDTAADLGHDRPAGSPRAQLATLATPADAADTAHRMALAVERARYARDPGPEAAYADDARAVCTALRAESGRGVRFRSQVLPRSVLRSAGSVSQRAYDVLDSADAWWQRGLRRLRSHAAG